MSKQVLVYLYIWIVAIAANNELTSSKQHASNDSVSFCQTGLFLKDGHCKCGVYPYHIMYCNGTHSFLLNRYCATFDEENRLLSAGFCLHNSQLHLPNSTEPKYYHLLKQHDSAVEACVSN